MSVLNDISKARSSKYRRYYVLDVYDNEEYPVICCHGVECLVSVLARGI